MTTGIGFEYGTNPLPEIRAGKTGVVETLTSGGVKATGTITFADNPTAGDTITINGVSFEFVASGATGNEIDISGVNLAGTLDNMIAVLNASVVAAVALATYTEDGATVLTITYDAYGTAGNAFTLAASADTVSAATLTGGQELGVCSISTEPTKITLTQAVDQNFTLADGTEAQRKLVYLATKGSTGNVILTPANLTGGTTITLDAALEYTELRFMGGAWREVNGVNTLA